MKVTVPANRAADDVAGTCKVFGDTMLARIDEFREAVQRRDPQAYWRLRDSIQTLCTAFVEHMWFDPSVRLDSWPDFMLSESDKLLRAARQLQSEAHETD